MPVASLQVTYTSVTMMLTAVPEIGSLSTVTSATMAHFAGRAEAEINARIGKRYTLPIGSSVPVLTAVATDLASYYLFTRRPLVGSQSKSDPWLQKFKESRDLLDKIASGEIQLLDEGGAEVAANENLSGFYSTTQNYIPTFYEGDIENWQVDSDKIDAEDDKRD